VVLVIHDGNVFVVGEEFESIVTDGKFAGECIAFGLVVEEIGLFVFFCRGDKL
jgi:hypothetical protein